MGILDVRAGFAVEVQGAVPAEVDVLDPVVAQVGINHRADADLARDVLFVLQVRRLFPDDFQRFIHRLGQQILQVDRVALPGGKRGAFEGDHPEGYVDAILCPGVSHFFQHAEELAEMEILLIGDDVEAFIKVVGILAVDGGSDIPGGIDGGAVLFDNQAGRHVVLTEIHHLGTFAQGQQALVPQFLNDGFHLVDIKAFAGIAVKGDTEQIIDPGGVLEGNILEPGENLQGFGIAVLDPLEPGAAFILQGRILFRLFMEADVKSLQFGDAALLNRFLRAPLFVGADHLAELGAPVAEMVDAHGGVAQKVEDPFQAVADHGGGQVADMETLGDVDGRIVETDGFSLSDIGGTEAASGGLQCGHGFRREVHTVQEKVHISVHRLHGSDVRMRPGGTDGFRNLRRGHAQGVGQAEAGKGVVAEGGVRRNGQQAPQVFGGGEAFGFGPEGGHGFGEQGRDPGHGVHGMSVLSEGIRIQASGLRNDAAETKVSYHIVRKKSKID